MPKKDKPQIIVIVGPTSSGKSDLGIKLAHKFNGEIISADSRQVYCGMDIGTGKIARDRHKGRLCNTKTPFVSGGIIHHLIDVISPKKVFTANDFKKLGQKAIEEIMAKNKIAIIVGGTGFYIDVLLGRMGMAEVPPNQKLRSQFDKLTAKKLFKKLQKLDPERARVIDHHNKRRLIRALEIVLTTKKTSLNTKYKIPDTKYDILWVGIKPNNLESRIKIRLDRRLAQGMISEVKNLHTSRVSYKRLHDFGLEYGWVSKYLEGKMSKNEMKKNLYRDIVRYSKRQMTWFKRNENIHWITSLKQAEKIIKKEVE